MCVKESSSKICLLRAFFQVCGLTKKGIFFSVMICDQIEVDFGRLEMVFIIDCLPLI